MFGRTAYEFGTPPEFAQQWAPISKLSFDLDSTWTGVRVGVQRDRWDIHFQWLTPMQKTINGHLLDEDWVTPQSNVPDIVSSSRLRWNDGQTLELQGQYQLSDCFLGMPIEFWPMMGFKFQRFDVTGYDTTYILPAPGFIPGDAIDFKQQYYLLNFGAQFRTTLNNRGRRPILMTFQADGGPAWGYNVDHHLLRTGGDRFTMQNTTGGVFRIALVGEVPLTQRISVGLQADHTQIRTSGTHRLLWPSQGIDQSWTHGVKANSDQTMLSAFVRAHF